MAHVPTDPGDRRLEIVDVGKQKGIEVKNGMDPTGEFDAWLASMDDKLEQLASEVPQALGERLDYSPASLTQLERWLISTFPTVKEILDFDRYLLDRLSCYVGETIRLNTGRKWSIDFSRPDDVYYGLPVLITDNKSPKCPFSILGAAIDRRRGDFMETVLQRMMDS